MCGAQLYRALLSSTAIVVIVLVRLLFVY